MPKPRYAQISLEATPCYHCIFRCVRQSWLCGKNYEHRRQWLEDRLHEASTAFAIDVCAYSIMSNHYHVVLHINIAQAQVWNMDEVIKRWHQLYSGFALSQRYLSGATLGKAELATLNDEAEIWRERLMNVSWLMRTVNERIARQANSEDQCTGRFWGRFLLLQNRHTIHPVYTLKIAPAFLRYHTSCIYLKNCSCIFKIPYILYIKAGLNHRLYWMRRPWPPAWP